jgi:signal transduction histidine kinase
MFHMHRAMEPRATAARPGLLGYALGAAGAAAVAIIAWSIWAGSLPEEHGTSGGGTSPWGFGVLALVVVAVCAALAGYFHARAQALKRALAAATVNPVPALSPPPPITQRAPAVPAADVGADAGIELLLRALPGPAWLFTRAGDGGALRLAQHNEPARTLLRDAGLARPDTWDGLLQALPGGLGAALHQLSPGACIHQDGWSARLEQIRQPSGPTALLLTLQPIVPPALADDSAADHESFSYTVSHDLRAPIRVVEGFTRILKEDYGRLLDRIGNDHLDRVLGAAARMNSMIDALLALSQLSTQPLARQPVNLSQLAGFVIDDLKRESPQRAVEVTIQPGLMARGDPTLLRMVLENLLGNAWKYSGKCDVARIGFEMTVHEGREVYVVRDNGAGFDMRFADRLFGVFQRLHSANDFQGTGVGLASVRRIVRRHGGEVWAESEVGKGARFYFTLGVK